MMHGQKNIKLYLMWSGRGRGWR